MLVKYGAYLVRYWGEASHVRRVEVVHIQTGDRVLFSSVEEAMAWIDERNAKEVPSDDGSGLR